MAFVSRGIPQSPSFLANKHSCIVSPLRTINARCRKERRAGQEREDEKHVCCRVASSVDARRDTDCLGRDVYLFRRVRAADKPNQEARHMERADSGPSVAAGRLSPYVFGTAPADDCEPAFLAAASVIPNRRRSDHIYWLAADDLVEGKPGAILERRGGAEAGPQADSVGAVPSDTTPAVFGTDSRGFRPGRVRDDMEQPGRGGGDADVL